MDESSLKSALVKEFKSRLPTWVVLRHEDVRTAGIPDISVTGKLRTTWVEAKYANPEFKSHGIQELTMLRLGQAGLARYVVYELTKEGEKLTHVFPPRDLKSTHWLTVGGHDHGWVVSVIEHLHS